MDDVTFAVTISSEHADRLKTMFEYKDISVNQLIEQLIDKAYESIYEPR